MNKTISLILKPLYFAVLLAGFIVYSSLVLAADGTVNVNDEELCPSAGVVSESDPVIPLAVDDIPDIVPVPEVSLAFQTIETQVQDLFNNPNISSAYYQLGIVRPFDVIIARDGLQAGIASQIKARDEEGNFLYVDSEATAGSIINMSGLLLTKIDQLSAIMSNNIFLTGEEWVSILKTELVNFINEQGVQNSEVFDSGVNTSITIPFGGGGKDMAIRIILSEGSATQKRISLSIGRIIPPPEEGAIAGFSQLFSKVATLQYNDNLLIKSTMWNLTRETTGDSPGVNFRNTLVQCVFKSEDNNAWIYAEYIKPGEERANLANACLIVADNNLGDGIYDLAYISDPLEISNIDGGITEGIATKNSLDKVDLAIIKSYAATAQSRASLSAAVPVDISTIDIMPLFTFPGLAPVQNPSLTIFSPTVDVGDED